MDRRYNDNPTRAYEGINYSQNRRFKLTKINGFKKMIITSAIVLALVSGGVAISNNISEDRVPETSLGIIYNDKEGISHFESGRSLIDYCEENNFDVNKLQYNRDSAGEVVVANSSFIKIENENTLEENESLEETDYGTIYNDEKGFTTFESFQELEDYCTVNNFDISEIKYHEDSAGIVTVGNSSFVKKIDSSSKTKVK